jgi:hypothetical protein
VGWGGVGWGERSGDELREALEGHERPLCTVSLPSCLVLQRVTQMHTQTHGDLCVFVGALACAFASAPASVRPCAAFCDRALPSAKTSACARARAREHPWVCVLVWLRLREGGEGEGEERGGEGGGGHT